MMGGRIIGVELDRALEVSFGIGPLKAVHIKVPKRRVDFRDSVVDFERLERRRRGPIESLPGSYSGDPNVPELSVAVGQPRVCQSVVRVDLDRLLEALDAPVQGFFRSLVPIIAAL